MSYTLQSYDTYKLKEMKEDIEKELIKRKNIEDFQVIKGQTNIDDFINEVK